MITVTILTICFLTAISCKIKKVKAPVITALTWYFHFIFLVLSVLCLILMITGYGFKGTQTERVIFSLYAGSGMVIYGLSKPGNDAKHAYLLLLFGFPFVLALGLLLPPLRILTMVAVVTLLVDSDFHRYKIDDDYALQTKTSSILSAYPIYSMVSDKYLLFEKITPDVVKPGDYMRALKMNKKGTDSVRIQLWYRKNKIDTVIAVND
ncbi:MAG TPA: hypothetical protein VM802_05590 [Chitinophaga sp.]|uniref:hypothetical protein n=1 Tax=Chitinophaga sp. TaxID=1869181 RepID=UPI002CF30DE5|nr:hypothetical protein [Chitinophaga sp.]HVI44317.1 hypothetical protein [Chitinophaga sp.]